MSYYISFLLFFFDLCNLDNNMQPFPEIKQTDFLKSKISRSCLATFNSLFIKLEASSPSLVSKICSSLKQTIPASFMQVLGGDASLSI